MLRSCHGQRRLHPRAAELHGFGRRDLEAGERLTLTVNRRPVADILPHVEGRDPWVPSAELRSIVREAPADPGLLDDLAEVRGVLRAADSATRAKRLATLSRVRGTYPLLPIDPETASCFAGLASAELARGRRPRRHDTWIAATAMRHAASVVTQDTDFSSFEGVAVQRA
ncbi:MAG TPA: PIN domain-containing protein [Solirubrobacterales bacterium]|nr:PIN domain-containing protein [Solirubrobacterales bacterium]